MGQVAEVSSGDISGGFAGLTLGSGDLTVTPTSGSAINVAAGTYHSVGDLASAINAAAGSTVASVNSTTGALTLSGATLAGATVTAGTLTSTGGGAAAATGDLSKEGLSINGTAIDLSSAKSLQDVSDAINAAGITGVSAAVSGDGKGINFYSSSALTIADTGGQIIGTNAKDDNSAATYTAGTAATTGGSLATGSVATVDSANDLISRVDVALKTVSDFAAQLGAVQNRFQSTISTVAAQTTNLQASQSTIQDADFASETANLSKAQVLQQAGISVLAQANSNPQQVLKLLQ